jgi:MFS transporter, UMF1 family
MELHPKSTKKNIFLWALYDFANTPMSSAMGGLFLAQWIVLDNKIDDIWYGSTFTFSTILLLLTSPFWGAWSDKVGKRLPFLKWNTVILILIGLTTGFIATSSIDRIPKVILVLILFFLLQYVYQISLIFYNALLENLSTPKTRGKISGIGQAFGEISWLFGNVLLLPFATGTIVLLGQAGRGQVFLPATFVLIILGLPMIFWFKETTGKKLTKKITPSTVYKETILGLKTLFKENKNASLFLLSFMLLSDALLTASLYFALFLDQVYKITDAQKIIVVAALEVVSTTSAVILGRIGDKSNLKKILIFACLDLTLVYSLMSVNSSLTVLYILATLVGFGYGGFYTLSRAMLTKLAPPSRLGEYFGFYSTFQKFASIIGPTTWGIITLVLKDLGPVRYRIGIASLSFLMLLGTILLFFVKDKQYQALPHSTKKP